jgi:hypothetical protein
MVGASAHKQTDKQTDTLTDKQANTNAAFMCEAIFESKSDSALQCAEPLVVLALAQALRITSYQMAHVDDKS